MRHGNIKTCQSYEYNYEYGTDRYRKCVRMIEFAVEERACREEGWRSQPASSGRVSMWRSWWCLNSLYRKDQVQHLFVSFIVLTLLIIVYLTTHAHKKRNIDKQRWNKRLDYDIVLMRTLYNEYFTLITVFVTIETQLIFVLLVVKQWQVLATLRKT